MSGLNPKALFDVLQEVANERLAQHAQWGEQNHPDGVYVTRTSLNREDEARRECQSAFQRGQGTWEHILREEFTEAVAAHDVPALRAELVQVAAVAVAWIEAIDRRPTQQEDAD